MWACGAVFPPEVLSKDPSRLSIIVPGDLGRASRQPVPLHMASLGCFGVQPTILNIPLSTITSS